MRVILLLMVSLLLMLALGLVLFGCKDESATKYNDAIVMLQIKVAKPILELNTAVDKEKQLKLIERESRGALAELNALKPYQDGEKLKAAAIALFEFYVEISTKDYVEVLRLSKKCEQVEALGMSKKCELEKVEKIITKIGKKEKVFGENFTKAQREFAKRYNMRIEENPTQRKVNEL